MHSSQRNGNVRAMREVHVLVLLLIVLCALQVHGVCMDISTSACESLHRADPDICKNTRVVDTACPKFCNRCNLTCYSCPLPTQDISACDTTQECKLGELCQLREIQSSVDHRHEYTSSCADPQECDGNSVLTIVGRDADSAHDIHNRNLVVTCCSDDLCNMPSAQTTLPTTSSTTPTTTTTTTTTSRPVIITTSKLQPIIIGASGCARDILVIMQVAAPDYRQKYMINDIMMLLLSIVHDIEIGPRDNLMELLFVENGVAPMFRFANYRDKTSLLHGLYVPVTSLHRTNTIDTASLINFVQTQCFISSTGDRPNYANNIILFVDHRAYLSQSLRSVGWTKTGWERISRDVIVVNIGGSSSTGKPLNPLATDSNHILHVSGYDSVYTAKKDILRLLCS